MDDTSYIELAKEAERQMKAYRQLHGSPKPVAGPCPPKWDQTETERPTHWQDPAYSWDAYLEEQARTY